MRARGAKGARRGVSSHPTRPDRRGGRRPPAALLLVLLILAAAHPRAARAAGSDELPFELTADVIDYDAEQELYVAEGHVRIVQEKSDRSLDADWAIFSTATKRGVASGHVVMVDGDERLDAEFGLFNVDTLQGLVYEGRFETVDEAGTAFRAQAEQMVKSGEDSYEFWRAVFTTCKCPDPEARDPWHLRAKSADVEVGGYGTARNASFEILGVPVIWVPWIMFPVKTERESGILFPEFGWSKRRGYEVGLPIFFALGDPVNLTLTPRYMSRRGYKQDGDLEAVWGSQSWARARGSYIHDEEVVDQEHQVDKKNDAFLSSTPPQLPIAANYPFGPDRWATWIEGEAFGPERSRFTADVKLTSDNEHPDDFRDLQEFNKDRFLESVAFGEVHVGPERRIGLVAGTRWADDLQSPDPQDRDEFLLQRFADVTARGLRGTIEERTGIVGSFDTRYILYRARDNPQDQVGGTAVQVGDEFFDTGFDALPDAREGINDTLNKLLANPPPGFTKAQIKARLQPDPNGDDFPGGPENDGEFQEGEPLADEGNRVTLYPRLSRPFRIAGGLFDVTPEAGYRQSLYHTDLQGFEQHGLATGRVELETLLQRSFDLESGRSIDHVLAPKLTWLYVDPVSESGSPVFVPVTRLPQTRVRQLETDNILVDPADRVQKSHLMILGFGNRFYYTGPRGRTWLGDFTISADWDFESGSMGSLVLDGSTTRFQGVGTRFNLTFDPDHERIDEGLLDVAWTLPNRMSFGVRYRYLRQIPLFFESFRGSNSDRFDEYKSGFGSVNQIEARATIPLFERIVLSGQTTYSIEDDLRLRSRGAIDYVSGCKCWAIGVEVGENRENGAQVNFRITLLGLGSDPTRPFTGANPYAIESGF